MMLRLSSFGVMPVLRALAPATDGGDVRVELTRGVGGLVQGSDGFCTGTTRYVDDVEGGVVFRLALDGALTVLHFARIRPAGHRMSITGSSAEDPFRSRNGWNLRDREFGGEPTFVVGEQVHVHRRVQKRQHDSEDDRDRRKDDDRRR